MPKTKKTPIEKPITIRLFLNGKVEEYKTDSILGWLKSLKINPKLVFTIPKFEFKFGNKVIFKQLGIYKFKLMLDREFNQKIFAKNISLMLGSKNG